MAKLKMKKYPKKPKAGASVKVMESYLKRRAAVDKDNKARTTSNKKQEKLRAKITGL